MSSLLHGQQSGHSLWIAHQPVYFRTSESVFSYKIPKTLEAFAVYKSRTERTCAPEKGTSSKGETSTLAALHFTLSFSDITDGFMDSRLEHADSVEAPHV